MTNVDLGSVNTGEPGVSQNWLTASSGFHYDIVHVKQAANQMQVNRSRAVKAEILI